MKVRSIMCCCGGGVGSSFIVQINVQDVLKKHGIEGISVDHVSVSEISMHQVDLFVVGGDLTAFLADKPRVITLDNIMSKDELETKLLAALEAAENE
ncbi:PTS sugar transporter subunit IIB [uncultured Parolsenella sp.]|uniref:PTS sugar transporter subunit IIB n=1 Tax=uncultured Parolsenella sp. TaxID=2083008 RepID=UPI0026009D92|nr:PTS sugar transporter subunit IIB [uncultured Parolsenella sp.]